MTKSNWSHPLVKRVVLGKTLGILFGLLCVYLASQGDPSIWDIKNPIFWSILVNRAIIGFVVALVGFITIHPVFKFAFRPWFRGSIIGAFISLDIAIPTLMMPNADEAMKIFWATIIAGAIYGLIIDLVATKYAGEGKVLIVEK